jgi:uncharacterized protein (TIGR02996 family)
LTQRPNHDLVFAVTTRQELLRGIYASPRDRALRAAYADALVEEGDPRGELIALQLARAGSGAPPSERERELLQAHRDEWLGALRPFVSDEDLLFDAGFLLACLVTSDAVADAVGLEEWSTVEAIIARSCPRVHRVDDPPAEIYPHWLALVRHPVLAGLRALGGIPTWLLAELCDAGERELALEAVSCVVPIQRFHYDNGFDRIARCRLLPQLRSLNLSGFRIRPSARFLSDGGETTRLLSQLETLELVLHTPGVLAEKDWMELIVRAPALRAFRLGHPPRFATLSRDEPGPYTAIRIDLRGPPQSDAFFTWATGGSADVDSVADAVEILRALDADAIREIVIEGAAFADLDATSRARLEEEARRFPKLTQLRLP